MTGERMFPFITRTHNPIGGGHRLQEDGKIVGCYECPYCWATDMKNRYKWGKYLGDYRLIESELSVRYKPDDFTFVCDMIELGLVPVPILMQFFDWLQEQKGNILLLAKNPKMYADLFSMGVKFPKNLYLGATIESDIDYPTISKAPSQNSRLYWMTLLSQLYSFRNRIFISIEPILDFNLTEFETSIYRINPWAVAVGYDNYNNKLPEPRRAETEALIAKMEEYTTVYRKSIREAWDA